MKIIFIWFSLFTMFCGVCNFFIPDYSSPSGEAQQLMMMKSADTNISMKSLEGADSETHIVPHQQQALNLNPLGLRCWGNCTVKDWTKNPSQELFYPNSYYDGSRPINIYIEPIQISGMELYQGDSYLYHHSNIGNYVTEIPNGFDVSGIEIKNSLSPEGCKNNCIHVRGYGYFIFSEPPTNEAMITVGSQLASYFRDITWDDIYSTDNPVEVWLNNGFISSQCYYSGRATLRQTCKTWLYPTPNQQDGIPYAVPSN